GPPLQQPRQESLRGIDLSFLFGRRSWASQPIKDVGHRGGPWGCGFRVAVAADWFNASACLSRKFFTLYSNAERGKLKRLSNRRFLMVPDIVELRKDLGFVEDLARFSENILSEKQVRAKYHLFDESAWVALGVDEAFVEAVELERTRRVRSGATKRELAQLR